MYPSPHREEVADGELDGVTSHGTGIVLVMVGQAPYISGIEEKVILASFDGELKGSAEDQAEVEYLGISVIVGE